MTSTEGKALKLLNEVSLYKCENVDTAPHKDLCVAFRRAIEQHEAFEQKVSNIVSAYVRGSAHCAECEWENLKGLIIPAPKPDPLVEAMLSAWPQYADRKDACSNDADALRAALEARGLTITTIEKD